MSQQIVHIAALLTTEELSIIDDLVAKANFINGKLTASMAAMEVKNNAQIEANNEHLIAIQKIITTALQQSPLFNIAALPKEIFPFLISKYAIGNDYGWHVDSPMMYGKKNIRTDMAMTIFLSDPSTYDGGELVININGNMMQYKPTKGDAILYPCQFLHCVKKVNNGERVAAVTWIQSNVKDASQRQILFEINQVHSALYQQAPNAPATNLLLQSHSNLYRMWADV
jgi:PKHD-type hydroxylase